MGGMYDCTGSRILGQTMTGQSGYYPVGATLCHIYPAGFRAKMETDNLHVPA